MKSDRLYRTNVKRLALLALPTWLRRPVAAALVYAGVSPLGRLLGELRKHREETSYRLHHNGQVCKLRGALNDAFDPEQRRITIEDSGSAAAGDAALAWQRECGRWLMVPRRGGGALTLSRQGYGGTHGLDFWVSVPSGLLDAAGESQLRAMTNMYKLAGKRFAITYK